MTSKEFWSGFGFGALTGVALGVGAYAAWDAGSASGDRSNFGADESGRGGQDRQFQMSSGAQDERNRSSQLEADRAARLNRRWRVPGA